MFKKSINSPLHRAADSAPAPAKAQKRNRQAEAARRQTREVVRLLDAKNYRLGKLIESLKELAETCAESADWFDDNRLLAGQDAAMVGIDPEVHELVTLLKQALASLHDETGHTTRRVSRYLQRLADALQDIQALDDDGQ